MALTTRHGDHLLQITRLGMLNAWLVREDDGTTLVDTTLGRTAARDLVDAARDVGWGDLRRIVLTHAHADHVGAVDDLVDLLPDDVELLVSERDHRFLRGDTHVDPQEGASRGSWKRVAAQPTRFIADGDRIGSLLVIATPGHTPGHVSLLDTRDGTLIAGDAFKTLGGLATGGDPSWRFPLVWIATGNRSLARDTGVALLARGDVRRIAPGHGQLVPVG